MRPPWPKFILGAGNYTLANESAAVFIPLGPPRFSCSPVTLA
jgi:hypothetical protein